MCFYVCMWGVCVCILCCSGRWVVHYAVCVSSRKASVISTQSPALALTPYLSPTGAPLAHSTPQGQCAGAPEETHTPITSSSTHELPLITMGEHGAFVFCCLICKFHFALCVLTVTAFVLHGREEKNGFQTKIKALRLYAATNVHPNGLPNCNKHYELLSFYQKTCFVRSVTFIFYHPN